MEDSLKSQLTEIVKFLECSGIGLNTKKLLLEKYFGLPEGSVLSILNKKTLNEKEILDLILKSLKKQDLDKLDKVVLEEDRQMIIKGENVRKFIEKIRDDFARC